MKLVIVVPDGMCDWRYPDLNNLSPIEYAHTPAIDNLVKKGQVGLVRTMHQGLPLGSLVAFLGILGYDPRLYFPLGRSIFEARALGIELGPADMAFRCNIVQVSDDDRLLDFTANQIKKTLAQDYLANLQLAAPFEIYHDLSYRNVLVYRDSPLAVNKFSLFEPHENMGSLIKNILPRYNNKLFKPLADMMLASRRNNLMLWPWGVSRMRTFPQSPFKIHLVTALSFLYGMAKMLGLQATIPPGTTGYLDSDLGAKFTTLTQHLSDVDIGLIHCNAPDEESHIYNLQGKVQAIENIDRLIIEPLLNYLDNSGEPYRILFCPDHYTCCSDGKHHNNPVPYVVTGSGIEPNHSLSAYSEVFITEHIKDVSIESHHLISNLLFNRS